MIAVLQLASAIVVGTIAGVLPVKLLFDRQRRRTFDRAVADVPRGVPAESWRQSMLAIYDPKGRRKFAGR